MSEILSQIYALLFDQILPQLKGIHASQEEQRKHSECLHRDIRNLHAEIQIRFAELRAEIAACRQEIEDAMVTIGEREAGDPNEISARRKKRLVH